LENALSLDPAIRLEKATDVPDYEIAGTPGAGRYDLVIFDNVAPRPVKAPAIWSFGMPDPQYGVRETGIDAHPTVVDWSKSSPVMRYADFSDLNISQSHRVSEIAASGAETLVEGSDGPLVVSSQSHGRRTLYNSWSLLDSDFPLRVSFPIFVANSISWLTTGQARAAVEAGGITAAAGETFTIATPDNSLSLDKPDGTEDKLTALDGEVTIRSADRAGIYHAVGHQTNTAIAVNVLNEAASDVRTKSFLDVSGKSISASKNSGFALSELWRPIICVVLILLAGEWLLYMRRS
jgi:hypothetical protein